MSEPLFQLKWVIFICVSSCYFVGMNQALLISFVCFALNYISCYIQSKMLESVYSNVYKSAMDSNHRESRLKLNHENIEFDSIVGSDFANHSISDPGLVRDVSKSLTKEESMTKDVFALVDEISRNASDNESCLKLLFKVFWQCHVADLLKYKLSDKIKTFVESQAKKHGLFKCTGLALTLGEKAPHIYEIKSHSPEMGVFWLDFRVSTVRRCDFEAFIQLLAFKKKFLFKITNVDASVKIRLILEFPFPYDLKPAPGQEKYSNKPFDPMRSFSMSISLLEFNGVTYQVESMGKSMMPFFNRFETLIISSLKTIVNLYIHYKTDSFKWPRIKHLFSSKSSEARIQEEIRLFELINKKGSPLPISIETQLKNGYKKEETPTISEQSKSNVVNQDLKENQFEILLETQINSSDSTTHNLLSNVKPNGVNDNLNDSLCSTFTKNGFAHHKITKKLEIHHPDISSSNRSDVYLFDKHVKRTHSDLSQQNKTLQISDYVRGSQNIFAVNSFTVDFVHSVKMDRSDLKKNLYDLQTPYFDKNVKFLWRTAVFKRNLIKIPHENQSDHLNQKMFTKRRDERSFSKRGESNQQTFNVYVPFVVLTYGRIDLNSLKISQTRDARFSDSDNSLLFFNQISVNPHFHDKRAFLSDGLQQTIPPTQLEQMMHIEKQMLVNCAKKTSKQCYYGGEGGVYDDCVNKSSSRSSIVARGLHSFGISRSYNLSPKPLNNFEQKPPMNESNPQKTQAHIDPSTHSNVNLNCFGRCYSVCDHLDVCQESLSETLINPKASIVNIQFQDDYAVNKTHYDKIVLDVDLCHMDELLLLKNQHSLLYESHFLDHNNPSEPNKCECCLNLPQEFMTEQSPSNSESSSVSRDYIHSCWTVGEVQISEAKQTSKTKNHVNVPLKSFLSRTNSLQSFNHLLDRNIKFCLVYTCYPIKQCFFDKEDPPDQLECNDPEHCKECLFILVETVWFLDHIHQEQWFVPVANFPHGDILFVVHSRQLSQLLK